MKNGSYFDGSEENSFDYPWREKMAAKTILEAQCQNMKIFLQRISTASMYHRAV